MTIVKLLLYFVAGLLQWSAATLRTWFIANGKIAKTMYVVFVEELLLVGVSAYVINHPKEWFLLLSGALGGAIGSGICLTLSMRRKK